MASDLDWYRKLHPNAQKTQNQTTNTPTSKEEKKAKPKTVNSLDEIGSLDLELSPEQSKQENKDKKRTGSHNEKNRHQQPRDESKKDRSNKNTQSGRRPMAEENNVDTSIYEDTFKRWVERKTGALFREVLEVPDRLKELHEEWKKETHQENANSASSETTNSDTSNFVKVGQKILKSQEPNLTEQHETRNIQSAQENLTVRQKEVENKTHVDEKENEPEPQPQPKKESQEADPQPKEEKQEDINQPLPLDWAEEKRQSWQEWCEDATIPNHPYVYDEQQAEGLKFDVYKTPADKEQGNKAASIHYTKPNEVTLETKKDQTPDFEFFDKLVLEAKKDNIPGITFEGEMTPEFQARLAAACVKHGLKMTNGPKEIDPNLLGNVNDAALQDKVKTFNKRNAQREHYETVKEMVNQEVQDGKTIFNLDEETKKLKDENGQPLSQEDKRRAAVILYAVYVNAGAKVTDVDKVFNNPDGLINVPDLKFMPKEVQETINAHNINVQEQIMDRVTKNRRHAPEDNLRPYQTKEEIALGEFKKVETNASVPLKKAQNGVNKTNIEKFILNGIRNNKKSYNK